MSIQTRPHSGDDWAARLFTKEELDELFTEPQKELTPKEQEAFVRAFFGMDHPNHDAEQARLRLYLGEQDHRDFTALSE